jgi:hypothetical protein
VIPFDDGGLVEDIEVVEVLQDEVEGFEVFFDVGAGVVQGVDDVLLVLVVHLVQDASPDLSEVLNSLHALRFDES